MEPTLHRILLFLEYRSEIVGCIPLLKVKRDTEHKGSIEFLNRTIIPPTRISLLSFSLDYMNQLHGIEHGHTMSLNICSHASSVRNASFTRLACGLTENGSRYANSMRLGQRFSLLTVLY